MLGFHLKRLVHFIYLATKFKCSPWLAENQNENQPEDQLKAPRVLLFFFVCFTITDCFFFFLQNHRCKSGEEEVKKCTPFSNTECRKRAPSPTEASPARPTPTPTSPPDIGNWTSLFHAKPSAQHYFKRCCTSLLIYFYFFQVFQ